MKKLLFCALLLLPTALLAQENISDRPKLFTMHNAKVSLGLGIETGLMINQSSPSNMKVVFNKNPANDSTTIYYSWGLVADLYSANSILGLLSGINKAKYSFGVEDNSGNVDYFNISRLEIPLFLKIRPGLVNGTSHYWVLLGGYYNIPLTCSRYEYNKSNIYYGATDNNIQQLSSNFSVAGIFGYEFFSKKFKYARLAIYSKVSYPLGNTLNSNYQAFQPSGGSVLSEYPNYDIRDLRISIGVKMLFRFGDVVKSLVPYRTK